MKLTLLSFGGGLFLLPLLATSPFTPPDSPNAAEPKYIGASKCKSCHQGDAKGNIYETWENSSHSKAFEVLGSDEAKKIAKEKGIKDPQKSDDCLQCHVTAAGADKKQIKRGFKHTEGIGCESCHGPGENHAKIRMKEAMKGGEPSPVAADEIKTGMGVSLCKECHNEKSPTYKPFCFKERMNKIRHIDPRKGRSEEELKALKEKCTDDCEVCAKKKDQGN